MTYVEAQSMGAQVVSWGVLASISARTTASSGVMRPASTIEV